MHGVGEGVRDLAAKTSEKYSRTPSSDLLETLEPKVVRDDVYVRVQIMQHRCDLALSRKHVFTESPDVLA